MACCELPAAATLNQSWVEAFGNQTYAVFAVQLSVDFFVLADKPQVVFEVLRELPAGRIGDVAEDADLGATSVVELDADRPYPVVIHRKQSVFHV